MSSDYKLAHFAIGVVAVLFILLMSSCQLSEERRNYHTREMAKQGLCAKPIPGNMSWFVFSRCE